MSLSHHCCRLSGVFPVHVFVLFISRLVGSRDELSWYAELAIVGGPIGGMLVLLAIKKFNKKGYTTLMLAAE